MEKRGLSERLEAAGSPQAVFFADEMRVGLIGQVRRRWTPRGFKLRQAVEFTYEWSYLNLAVDPMKGILKWSWTRNMKALSIAPVLGNWSGEIEALIWDGARGHFGSEYDEIEIERIQQPPYAPELQPAERVFEYVRGQIEGIVYGKLKAKKDAVETALQELAACPEQVKSLTGWDWIRRSLVRADCT